MNTKRIGIVKWESMMDAMKRRDAFYDTLQPYEEGVNQAAYAQGVKQKKWPTGSKWCWHTGCVYTGEEAEKLRDASEDLKRKRIVTYFDHHSPFPEFKGEPEEPSGPRYSAQDDDTKAEYKL